MTNQREVWDRHWRTLQREGAVFGTLASIVRKTVLCRAVRHYTDCYFPAQGRFVEAGCGTAQASGQIAAQERLLVGLDFSLPALLAARGGAPHRGFVCGDIRHLPFRDGSLAGIWNLGVMEHFSPQEGRAILLELRRALRPGACALLFWPPEFGLSRWVLAPFEWVRSLVRGRTFRFFPDEVNRIQSFRHARETLRSGGLDPVATDFSLRDSFIHVVAVGRKPEA